MTCAYEFIDSKDNVECVVQKKPNKRVLAAKPLSKSDIMVPVSSNFKLLKDGERAEMIAAVTFKCTDYKFAVVAPTSKTHQSIPFQVNFLSGTDKSKANCVVDHITVNYQFFSNCKVDGVKCTPTVKATVVDISLPVIKINSNVKVDEELFIAKTIEALVSTKHQSFEVDSGPAQKVKRTH